VIGRRGDGYHLLDSLVAFADVGDRVTVAPGEGLRITGPQAAALPVGDDNLCLRAARAMGGGVRVTLDKVLPVSSALAAGRRMRRRRSVALMRMALEQGRAPAADGCSGGCGDPGAGGRCAGLSGRPSRRG
jgi:4-diphosphocytidyl-2-C-methyl-D-erythritol kinase